MVLQRRCMAAEVRERHGEKVLLRGWCHRYRDLGGIRFVMLRDRTGICQIALEDSSLPTLSSEDCIEVAGIPRLEKRAPGGIEVVATAIQIVSPAVEEPAIQVNGRTLQANLDSALTHRHLSLRHPMVNAAFKIEAAIVSGFRRYLDTHGFIEVFTPKIVAGGTEGGAELFEIRYFEQTAYLAQSPQFYKQTLVGSGFERVYETGHAYRAEEHNTSRHLNEYVSLDIEMGFIESAEELMALEEELITAMFDTVAERCNRELAVLGVELKGLSAPFQRVTLKDAQTRILKAYGKESPEGNLDPEGERLLCELTEAETGSPFVFVTAYPRSKRPMYASPLPEDCELTDSFDLLYRGLEVTTGGMRIHQYGALVQSMLAKRLDPAAFESYLAAFRHGMPPHGGFAIGLERLTAKMLGLSNVREASLFPRDRERLTP